MLSLSNKDAFISLVRLGIGHAEKVLPERIEWNVIETLAVEHGLTAVVLDGIEKVSSDKRPPQELLLNWIGEVLQSYESMYPSYKKAIASLAGWYNAHGVRMMVLKGYACSLNWPKPNHRPCGDIDIWQFGQQKEADETLQKLSRIGELENKISVDNSHHHHSVFQWGEFTVENHYDFINVYAHKSSRELEKIFKELGKDDSHFVEVNGEKVYLPSTKLHALFLIRHIASHFAAAEISLRQILDWAFFVKKHTKEVNWEWLQGVLEEYHMKDFFNIINAICVENLGFSADIFPCAQFLPSLKEKVFNDILEPEYGTAEPHGLINRIVYKYRRWQGNAWKQELCYNESRWEAFWYGIWAKILKPATI